MISTRSIERLIMYRLLLERVETQGVKNIYSKQIADLSGNTAAQVRRDLMLVGYTGNPKNGYNVHVLLEGIKSLLEPDEGIRMALVGVGNLGRAILRYFGTMKPKFDVVAAFDRDPGKVNRVISGCRCHHIDSMKGVIGHQRVQVGIITVPGNQAQNVADLLIEAGVKGLVNFAPEPILVPARVYTENMHMTTTIEKVAYFIRMNETGDERRERIE